MVWYVTGGIAAAAAVALLIFNYIRDRRYLKKKTSEAMSRELWSEVEAEREESRARQEKWREALGRAEKETR